MFESMSLDETLRLAAGYSVIFLGGCGAIYTFFALATYENIYNRKNRLRKYAMKTGQQTLWPFERPSILQCLYQAFKPKTIHEEYFV